MTPKKKEGSSASDSSSSSTSSSSSSSSSSGSESSSSDTGNSSTSNPKSGRVSTDSEKKKTKKKLDPAAKSKNDTAEAESTKNKEKPKRRGSNSAQKIVQVYSSESDDTAAKSKRKPPTKPKASATVTPIAKPAKATQKPPNKKPMPPIKPTHKATPKEGSKPLTKNDAQKKLVKTKSIFSPDNSSESDDNNEAPPAKLNAMKTAAVATSKAAAAATSKAAAAAKAKPKAPRTEPPPPSDKSRASSVSSNNSTATSNSSESSSDSETSADSARTNRTNATRVKPATKTRGRPRKPPAAVPPPDSDPNSTITTRKQTRSANARRSKHLTGRTPSESDTESESKSVLSKSPVKKAGPKGPACQRKPKARVSLVIEERKCPLDECDSSGHLGGLQASHFTLEACPLYHNRTFEQCKVAREEFNKQDEERKKTAIPVKSSHANNPTPEQKAYRDLVREWRAKSGESPSENDDSDPSKTREPLLSGCASPYDFEMFQNAQALASETIEEELRALPSVRGTKCIEMGRFEMEVWYQSPYPDDYARLPKLYVCEYCLRYMKSRPTLQRHVAKCVWRHPPGDEVYRKDKVSVWEVDGKRYKLYCQNLCLLAKFFLDHKTLYYDVEPFLFYVMTIADSDGCHTVGYFSKEKNSFLNYNVSCILTLPPYQRQGYGRLLIDFSYLLTRVEGKIGSPEKPLSDLGLISYRSYWKDVLLGFLCNLGGKTLSVKDISQEMAINSYDIVSTLQALGMMKYWKGKHIILKKQDVIEDYVERAKRRDPSYKEIDPACLKWTPFVGPHNPAST